MQRLEEMVIPREGVESNSKIYTSFPQLFSVIPREGVESDLIRLINTLITNR